MALGGTNYHLRCSTNNDPWASLEFTAAANFTAGDLYLLEDTVGVIINTVVSGDTAVLNYQAAKIVVPCVEVTSGNLGNMSVGCKVYADIVNNEVTSVAGTLHLCGIVLVTPSVGDETIEIHLMGELGIVA